MPAAEASPSVAACQELEMTLHVALCFMSRMTFAEMVACAQICQYLRLSRCYRLQCWMSALTFLNAVAWKYHICNAVIAADS